MIAVFFVEKKIRVYITFGVFARRRVKGFKSFSSMYGTIKIPGDNFLYHNRGTISRHTIKLWWGELERGVVDFNQKAVSTELDLASKGRLQPASEVRGVTSWYSVTPRNHIGREFVPTIDFNIVVNDLLRGGAIGPYICCFDLRGLLYVNVEWSNLRFYSSRGWLYYHDGFLWINFKVFFDLGTQGGYFRLSFAEKNLKELFRNGSLPVKLHYSVPYKKGLEKVLVSKFLVGYQFQLEEYKLSTDLIGRVVNLGLVKNVDKDNLVPRQRGHLEWVKGSKGAFGEHLTYPFRRASPNKLTGNRGL